MNPNSKRPATRKDVARLAGVSPTVVTYVVNDGPRPVAPGTRQRVLDAIEQLGYQPNAAARALKIGGHRTYGVLVSNVVNTFHATYVQELDRNMAERAYSMLLSRGAADLRALHSTHSSMLDRGAEGLVVLTSSVDDDEWMLQNAHLPIVLADRGTPLFGHVTVGPDFAAAGRLATEHLIQHGRRRIIPVEGPQLHNRSDLRLQGYWEAMMEAGLEPLDPIVTTWDRPGGASAAAEALETHPEVDGFVCFSDMLGIGALHHLQESGLRVPDDIAVVCIDGTIASEFSSPGLTAVRQPIEEMANFAVEALDKPRPEGFSHRIFPVELVPRKSCGC